MLLHARNDAERGGPRGGGGCPPQFFEFFLTINENNAQIVFEPTFEWKEKYHNIFSIKHKFCFEFLRFTGCVLWSSAL